MAETDAAAITTARPALVRFLKSHGDVPGDAAERLVEDAFNRQSVLCGSPETFAAGLRRLEDAGARHVVLWMDFGDLPRSGVEQSMSLAAGIFAGSGQSR